MFYVVVLPLVLQLLLPLALIAWVAWGRPRNWASWIAGIIATGSWLVGIGLGGLWLAVPAALLPLLVAVFIAASIRSFRRLRVASRQAAAPTGWRESLTTLALGAVALGGLLVVGRLASERGTPADTVDLAFPLRGGTYLVVNGGTGSLSNAHLATLRDEARYRPWRGQSYGVDLVRVNGMRARARGRLPSDPGAYRIFGDTVLAPCAGPVVRAEDGHPDQAPPHPDRARMTGNHVLIACRDAWVLLAHLRRGSVRVKSGEAVSAGAPLGVVGNSGNSNEPHLHVHAQRPGPPGMPFSGAPLHVRFDGRYLARNALVRRASPERVLSAGAVERPTPAPDPRP